MLESSEDVRRYAKLFSKFVDLRKKYSKNFEKIQKRTYEICKDEASIRDFLKTKLNDEFVKSVFRNLEYIRKYYFKLFFPRLFLKNLVNNLLYLDFFEEQGLDLGSRTDVDLIFQTWIMTLLELEMEISWR